MAVYRLDDFVPDLPPAGTYWIAASATVAGRVSIAPNVGVWFGAVARGDDELISIGEGTNVQDNAVLHVDPGYPLTIGRNCTIGHTAIVHGCSIGDNTLIGMGATIMNGASIGASCIIGANALVTENKIIPDNSLVMGAPAKVVRELDESAIAGLPAYAESYVRKWRRFAAGLAQLAA